MRPFFFQAKEAQLPQSFLIAELLHPSDHLHGPPQGPLQHLHVFITSCVPLQQFMCFCAEGIIVM